MTDIDSTLDELLRTYGSATASTVDLLCRRHPRDAVAFSVVESDLTGRDLTFGELDAAAGRFAAGLAGLGVSAGDRVATLMGKSGELVIALLAIWRLGAVHVPLFTAFAPAAIALRTTGNDTTVVIADASQRHKLEPTEENPAPPAYTVVTVGATDHGDPTFEHLLASAGEAPEPVAVGGDGTVIELFTSGTTGTPKGVPVPLRGVAGIHAYQVFGLDHSDDDVFWNAADPGWAYGLFYAIVGPLATGRRSLLLRAGFSPALTWEVLARFGVTNFAAGPTVYRALRSDDADVPGGLALRRCSSAGEPLTPEVIHWSREALQVPVRDHYGQTETGMTVANAWHPDLQREIVPGSMGRPLPGWKIDVLRSDADEIAPAGEVGRVAVDVAGSPLMSFTGYRDAPERTAERFSGNGRWYLTGDVASADAEGNLTFGSRDDDVILMAGYRIGPFEVESVLLAHDAVLEAAVVGEPDELRGEVVVAHVVTRPGTATGAELTEELQQLVKSRLAAHVFPRRIHYVDELPKTPSGKIQRFQLRRRADPAP